MKCVVLYPNIHKAAACLLAATIAAYFKEKQVAVACTRELASKIGALEIDELDTSEVLAVMAIGGDGTILRMAKEFPDWQYPVLGINVGTLGFMTAVPVNDLLASLEDLLLERYLITPRMMLEVTCHEKTYFAINDACIHRGRMPSLMEASVYIDEKFVCNLNADGLVVATPNGSTAYSLSAGGPIVMPALDCILLTPISPHMLSNRPLVMNPHSLMRIESIGHEDGVDLTVDGVIVEQLAIGDSVLVKRAEKVFRWVNLHRHDYYHTLRNKLGWNSLPRATPSR